MKKLIYSATTLIIAMFLYSCNSEEINELEKSEPSNENIAEDLNGIFHEIEKSYNPTNNRARSNFNTTLENEQNPYDKTGYDHNTNLDYLMSLDLTKSNICRSIDTFKERPDINLNFSCNELLEITNDGISNVINSDGVYNSNLLDDLLANKKIEGVEFQIVNTTFKDVFGLSDINEKIDKLKAAENYTINSELLNSKQKGRILRTFAIYRYSSYYWQNHDDPAMRTNGHIYSIADASAEHFAMHSIYSTAQDGGDIYSFASAVSAIAWSMMYW